MREIKFRVWHKQMNKMLSNDWLISAGVIYSKMIDNDGIELMQFTGLKDKNGKEIYCYDIIQSYYSDGSTCRHVVRWVDSDARFMIFDLTTDRECGGISHEWLNEYNKKVIGNIHENPELLNQ